MIPVRDTIPSEGRPVMTWLLIAANTLVFLYQSLLPEPAEQALVYTWGLVPATFSNPGWAAQLGLTPHPWPFLTTQFLHGSWLHLLGNMWMLWIFGDNVEDRMGPWRFLGFYLSCGLAAGALHFVTNLSSTVPTVGASGAIAGVLGAYFTLYPNARVLTLLPIFFYPLFFELPAAVFIGLWFAIQVLSGALSLLAPGTGGIAWWAHIGGFLAGTTAYRWFMLPRRRRRRVLYPWGPEGPPVIEYIQEPEPNRNGW